MRSGRGIATPHDMDVALEGLWDYVRQAGALQELAVPLIGTGRGSIKISRGKMVEMIAESFSESSSIGVFTGKLIIVIHPDDASNFQINIMKLRTY